MIEFALKSILANCVFVCCFSTISVFCQWKQLSATPYATALTATFTIGNKVYLTGGWGQTADAQRFLYEYDSETGKWSSKQSMPSAKCFHSAFSINGKGYVVGGDSTTLLTGNNSDLFEYNPATNTWTKKKPMPYPGGLIGMFSFVIDSVAYVGGGAHTVDAQTFAFEFNPKYYRYTPSKDEWVELGDLPELLALPASFVVNGKGYLACGENGNAEMTNDLFEYSPQTNKWVKKTSMPDAGRWSCIGVSTTNAGFVVGGGIGFYKSEPNVWKYNVDSDSWSKYGELPVLGNATWGIFNSATSVGETLYWISGEDVINGQTSYTQLFLSLPLNLTTDVQDEPQSNSLVLYPNPAQDFVTMHINNTPDSPFTIEVSDSFGTIVLQTETSENQVTLPTSSLPNGLFNVVAVNKINGDVMLFRKLIIHR